LREEGPSPLLPLHIRLMFKGARRTPVAPAHVL
jgi:hypothetical protein